jgi:two-component system, LytTR family, response regulator
MVNAIIIDDELHAQQTIERVLGMKFDTIKIVDKVFNVADAVSSIVKNEIQLIFLDINLPDGTGFDILKQIDYKKYKVIFITAYEEFAIQAIKFSALDYILKPVNPVELIKAVERVLHEIITDDYSKKMDAFFTNYNQNSNPQKIVLKTADKIHVVDIQNVIRCEADNTYTTFYLNDSSHIMVSKSIKKYEEMLVSQRFMRVHQSHLVNLNCISHFNKQDGGYLTMNDNSNIPVSNQKRPVLLEFLDSI